MTTIDTPAGRLELLERLVVTESPTGDTSALATLADLLDDEARAVGLVADRESHPTGDHLIWRLAGSGSDDKPLLFISHYDTVWPVGQLSTMPFRVDGDRVTGPGCFDTKGGIVALLAALDSIGDAPHRPITVLVIADEEIGSPTARALVEQHAAGAEAIFGLEPPHPDGSLKTARLGSTRVRIAVTGVEAHAALDPDRGVSAIDELVDQLIDVRSFLSGFPSVLANVGTIGGGGRTNVIAGDAYADIGMRFVDIETERAVLAGIEALQPKRAGAALSVTLLSNRPAWAETAAGRELLERTSSVAASIGLTLDGRPAAGAADTNVPGSLGYLTVDGLAPSGGGAHAVTEWMSLQSLEDRVRLIAALVTA